MSGMFVPDFDSLTWFIRILGGGRTGARLLARGVSATSGVSASDFKFVLSWAISVLGLTALDLARVEDLEDSLDLWSILSNSSARVVSLLLFISARRLYILLFIVLLISLILLYRLFIIWSHAHLGEQLHYLHHRRCGCDSFFVGHLVLDDSTVVIIIIKLIGSQILTL